MRIFLASLCLMLCLGSVQAQDRDVEQTIQSQIDAFLVDDFDTAFTYASPNIKRLFGSSERFREMVQSGFPMVWRPADVTYLEQREQGAGRVQNVLIRDANGVPHLLEYTMILTEQGWRIDGVRPLVNPPVGA